MCNLNILFRRNLKIDVLPFIMASTSHSYISNYHGEGFYVNASKIIVKQDAKINYLPYKQLISNSNVIITHQRYASSGHTTEYHQPFQNKDFVFVHNGVVNKFLKDKGSDSFGFFNDFIKEFERAAHNEREKNIVTAIKNLLDNESSGWYSMLLYDKITKCSYYFKSTSPGIRFYRYKGMLFITTNEDNKTFLSLLGKGRIKEIDVEDYSIYKIKITKKKIKVLNIDEIIHTENTTDVKESEEDVEDDVVQTTLDDDSNICFSCGESIRGSVYFYNDKKYCENCLDTTGARLN